MRHEIHRRARSKPTVDLRAQRIGRLREIKPPIVGKRLHVPLVRREAEQHLGVPFFQDARGAHVIFGGELRRHAQPAESAEDDARDVQPHLLFRVLLWINRQFAAHGTVKEHGIPTLGTAPLRAERQPPQPCEAFLAEVERQHALFLNRGAAQEFRKLIDVGGLEQREILAFVHRGGSLRISDPATEKCRRVWDLRPQATSVALHFAQPGSYSPEILCFLRCLRFNCMVKA